MTTDRKTFVGGSDMNTLAGGDAERIQALIEEKRGEREPEDLAWVLPVFLGNHTEAANRIWFEHATGRQVSDIQRQIFDGWRGCTLDGLTTAEDEKPAVFEAKFSLGFIKPEELLTKYLPQLTWNMGLAKVERACLSILLGIGKYELIEVTFDPFYAAELEELAAAFWRCVETGERWPGLPALKASSAPGTLRVIEVTESLNWHGDWLSAATKWLENRAAVEAHEEATKALKALIPDDAKEVHGCGIVASLNKKRAVTIKPREAA